MTRKQNNKKKIRNSSPSMFLLLFFWVMVFLLPALATRALIGWQIENATEESYLKSSQFLLKEMEIFKNELRLENVIYQSIRDVRPRLLALLPEKNDQSSLDTFCRKSAEILKKSANCPPAIIIAGSQETGQVGFYRDSKAGYVIGRHSSRTVIESIGLKNDEINPEDRRRFSRMINSILGDLIELPETPATIKTGFTARGAPDKIFSYYDFFSNEKKNRIKVFLLFSENDFTFQQVLSRSLGKSSPGTTRQLRLLKTVPERDFSRLKENRLSYCSPVPPETLRIGSHLGNSWYDHAIKSGIANRRPGKHPYAIITMTSGMDEIALKNHLPLINLAILLALFAGIYLIKQVKDNHIPGQTLQIRLRLSILLATVLPFASLIIAAHQFSNHFNNVVTRNLVHELRNELIMFENSIKANDVKHREKVNREVGIFKKIKDSSRNEIEAFLNERTGTMFSGYTMLRNDGLFLEKLPPANLSSSYDYQKLLLVRDLMLAQAYKIFELLKLISPDSEKAFALIPGFSTWKALRLHLDEVDTNNFFMQDGRYFPAAQADSSHFMISTHNFWPDDSNSGFAGILMLVIDRKQVFEQFLKELSASPDIFLKRNSTTQTHIAAFLCHDNSLEELNTEIAWPMNALKDKDLTEAGRRINRKKIQNSWIEEDQNGITRICSARGIADLPVKLAAKSETTASAVQEKLIAIIIPALGIYSFVLVYLISSLISKKFIVPLEMMIDGISSLESGDYPRLSHKSDDEFGSLICEFNLMVDGMRQRNLLDRFISKEVSESIADEAQFLNREKVELVFRAVMFIHIRNFSSICEQIPPENSIELLNIYFSFLEPQIESTGGQIDKYIGDGIMISFSSEKSPGSCEISGARAGLACKNVLPALNKKLRERGLPEIIIGIGLAAGNVIRGRIGSNTGRQDFTLIGDTVNLAARLESASHLDTESRILISEAIASKLDKSFRLSFLEEMKVKGKTNSVKVFQLH